MGSPPAATKALRDGRYVLLAPLGQGSQGTTWDAVDKREGRAVAVKAFDVRGARAWKDVELAEREARVLSELEHPALPRYVEHFEEDGVLYLVMEKVVGTPLSVLQKGGPRMREDEALRLLRDADRVLAYLHERHPPVIHRDIKPSNVIRRPDGSFGFVDFGAVRDRLRPEGGSTVVGTFGYMAPEQFQGRAGPGSDVYAVGATAVAMLTGDEPEKLPHRGLSLDVEAALGGSVSPHLRDVLTRMLEPDPDRRAPRIGPLLGSVPPPRSPRGQIRGEEAWQRLRDAVEFGIGDVRQARRTLRREAKRVRREARREAKRVRREALRDTHHHAEVRLAVFLQVVAGVALVVAQVAVSLALQFVVPLVLTVLSLVFGEKLRRAAGRVRLAGGQASDALGGALSALDHGNAEAEEVRVEAPTPPDEERRARVATAPAARGEDPVGDDEEAVDSEPEAAVRRGKRGAGSP
jgi:hypothetical protein